MARRVAWTAPAWEQLRQAAKYIERDSPRRAAALLLKASASARALDHFSERGRIVPEADDPSVRQIIIGKYRLIYRVTSTTVLVIAFVHCARDLPSAIASKKLP